MYIVKLLHIGTQLHRAFFLIYLLFDRRKDFRHFKEGHLDITLI